MWLWFWVIFFSSPPSKTKYQAQNKKEAQGVTHASTEPTYSPTWEEKVTVETDAEDAGHEGVISEGSWIVGVGEANINEMAWYLGHWHFSKMRVNANATKSKWSQYTVGEWLLNGQNY